jgi:hypothetical protein
MPYHNTNKQATFVTLIGGIISTSKEDRALLSLLPVVVMWIKEDIDLTEQEIRTVSKFHPKEFEFAQATPSSEMLKFMERYRDNKHYKDLIEIVLSEKGWRWVERTVEKCKKMPPLEDSDAPNACQKKQP